MIIFVSIILLNIVAILLTYHSLSDFEQKEKIVFLVVGVAVMYILTSIVYWLSTKGVEIKEVSEHAKNVITLMFVPINSILILPLFAKSYQKYKMGSLASDKFRNRVIIFGVILLIIFIIECSYFKDIQEGVIESLKKVK